MVSLRVRHPVVYNHKLLLNSENGEISFFMGNKSFQLICTLILVPIQLLDAVYYSLVQVQAAHLL